MAKGKVRSSRESLQKHVHHKLVARRYSLFFVVFMIIAALILGSYGVLATGYFITAFFGVVFLGYFAVLKLVRKNNNRTVKKKISEIFRDPNGIIAALLSVFGILTITYKLVLLRLDPLLGTLIYFTLLCLAFIWFSFYMYRMTKDLARVLILLIIAIITILIMFSAVYSTQIDDNSYFYVHDGKINSLNKFDAIYFSTVTFTTLGYGDITPVGHYRIFAVFEALTGYICVGLFVGALGLYFSDRSHHRRRK